LDITYDVQQPGTNVQLYECNGTNAQKWRIDGTRILSTAGLCLDVRGDDSANGTQVEVWTCNGGPNQVWKVSGLRADAGVDSGPADSGHADSGKVDSGRSDSGTSDSAAPDSGNPACTFDGDYESAANKYPPGGCYPWYPKSVFFQKIPANPVVDPNSEQYNAAQGYNNNGKPELIAFGAGQASEPVYYTHGGGVDMTLSCGAQGVSWGVSDCASHGNQNGNGQYVNLNGATLNFPPKFVIETAGDAHMSRIDSSFGDEFNAWASIEPSNISNGQTFDVGSAGLCDLHGDGTGCSGSTATNIPYSLGLVKAEDILACLDSGDPSCTLPYAVAWTPICNSNRFIYPATWSDGQCFGYPGGPPADSLRPPEGARGFLALTDAQVNALNVPDYAKVYLRTIDQEHFGFVDTDSGWSKGMGYASQGQGTWPYDVYGNPDPWATLAARVGVTQGSDGSYSFPLNATQIDTLQQIKWCLPTSSGLCDGQGSGPSTNGQ
jgi:hypothetical protein